MYTSYGEWTTNSTLVNIVQRLVIDSSTLQLVLEACLTLSSLAAVTMQRPCHDSCCPSDLTSPNLLYPFRSQKSSPTTVAT